MGTQGEVAVDDGARPPMAGGRARETTTLLLVAGVTVLLSVRLFVFVHRHSVNLLFSDQWRFWQGLFDGADLWTMWRWQVGPIRQGLGQMIVVAVAHLSGWNVRAETFVSAGIVSLAAALALGIAGKLRGRLSPADVFIPLVVLTVSQHELIVGTPNPAHGPLPLLFVMVFGLGLLVERPALRVGILSVTAFIATQTGFGLFLSVVAVPVLGVLLADAIRRRTAVWAHIAGLGLVLASFALFFYGYQPNPDVACFAFPDPRPERYPLFLSFLFLRSLETLGEGFRVYVGFALVLACVGLTAWSGWRTLASWGREGLPRVVFVLSAFTLLFALNSALGRACLGPEGAYSTRYVPYLIPFFVAGYLFLSTKLRSPRARAAILGAVCLLWATKEAIWTERWSVPEAGVWTRQKTAWLDCYSQLENTRVCTGMYSLGAADVDKDHIVEKVRFLREHKLGFFR